MIYNDGEFGSYLFGYKNTEDSSSVFDELYDSEDDAMESSLTKYGVKNSDWTEISDPEPYCQHDWINPVRVKGREIGKPEFGRFERLINGEWTEFEPKK